MNFNARQNMEISNFEFYNCDVIDLPSDNEFPLEVFPQSQALCRTDIQPKFSALLNCDILDLSESEDETLGQTNQQSQSERALNDLVSMGKNARLDAEFQQVLMYSGVAPKKSTCLDEEFRQMLGYDSRNLSVHNYSHEIVDQAVAFEDAENLNYNAIDALLNSSAEGSLDKKGKNKSTARKRKIKEEKVDDAYVENSAKGRPKSTRRASAPNRFGDPREGENNEYDDDLSAYNESYLDKEFITVTPKEEAILADEESEHIKQTPEKRHVCEFCLKRFRNVAHLREHRRIHTNEKPFSCERCNRGFRQRSHLKAHLKRDICTPSKISPDTHPDVANPKAGLICDHRCEECGDSFTAFADLRAHRNTHNENKPYECEQCGLGFDQEVNFVGHQKTCSGDLSLISASFEDRKGPPYICEFCKKDFRSKGHLRDHRRIHTNERPFQCLTCSRAFKQTSALRSHMKICKGDNTSMKTSHKVVNGATRNGLDHENLNPDLNNERLELDTFTGDEGKELTQRLKGNQSKTELTGRKRKFKSAAQLANEKAIKTSTPDPGNDNPPVNDIDIDKDDEDYAPEPDGDADSSATEIENEDQDLDRQPRNKRKSTPKKKKVPTATLR